MDESVIKELERPVSEKPLLSHAIREGAKLRPQCFGRLYLYGGSCAIGAAIHYMTGVPRELSGYLSGGVSRFIFDTFGVNRDMMKVIVELNDNNHMTREAIADVVEQWGF